MKKIIISMYDEVDGLLNGSTEVSSEELGFIYINTARHHSLQNDYDELDERYIKQIEILEKIVELTKKLEVI